MIGHRRDISRASGLRNLVGAGRNHHVRHLGSAGDAELAAALSERVTAGTVLVRDDVVAPRCALALAHLDPTLRLIVTIFDKTISALLRAFLPQAVVISPADLAVPSLAGPCLDTEPLTSFVVAEGRVEARAGDNGRLIDRTTVRPPRSFAVDSIIGALRSDHTGITTQPRACFWSACSVASTDSDSSIAEMTDGLRFLPS